MAKLQPRPTQTIKLLTNPEVEIVCYQSFTAQDVEHMMDDSKVGSVLSPLVRVIKSWNLTDENDNPLPINRDTVGMLEARDVKHITDTLEVSLTDFLAEPPTNPG